MPQATAAEHYTLYSTSACHLCELAEQLLQAARDAGWGVPWQTVDITESDELFERYGLLIPVLRAPGGGELNWPFTADQLQAFLQG